MSSRARSGSFRFASSALLLFAAACGSRVAADPNQREIAWTYGPTNGGATAEHVQGTGRKGGPAIAKGWQCRLLDGKRLSIQPYQLAASHPLFGKVMMSIDLFDKTGKKIGSVRSAMLTAGNASSTFEIAPDVAARLWDVVIYYVTP